MTRSYTRAQSPLSIKGAAVLITGAASGMGAAAARIFAEEGAHVAVTDLNGEGAEQVAASIVSRGGIARAWRMDVGDLASIEQVVGQAANTFDGLDCLINNAGHIPHARIGAENYEEVWERGIKVMLTAVPRAVRAALPWLRKSPYGRIVNTASTEAHANTTGFSVYPAAKAGVTGMTRSLAVDLGPEGITCNCILPGAIETGLTTHISDEHKAKFAKRRTALHRYGRPEEVAYMMLYLCLPGSSYITGATIPVDGGLLVRSY